MRAARARQKTDGGAVSEKTELEILADADYPNADELARRFAVQPHPNPRGEEEYLRIMEKPGFGNYFTDYMAHATWTPEEGWHAKKIEPFGPLRLDPAAAVLHYGQEVFEGLKVYRHEDGSLHSFRPAYNAARLNASCRRLAIPPLPIPDFLGAVAALARVEKRWVADGNGSSLYLRPVVFASESFLGVRSARRYEFVVLASPAGPYFKHGYRPIRVWVEQEYHRAGPGGMGDAKTGGNYAASLLPKQQAHEAGYDEVLFLDALGNSDLDELGGMNVFAVLSDGSVITPRLNGNILPGCTRSSIMEFLRRSGTPVREERIGLQWLIGAIEAGTVREMFACGTAAVVTSVGSLAGRGFSVDLADTQVTRHIYGELTAIQEGRRPDRFGWLYPLG